MLRRHLLALGMSALPVASAMAQPWWGDPAVREHEYEHWREEQWRADAARRSAWNEERERRIWEARRRAELQREWEMHHHAPPPPPPPRRY